MVKKSWHKLVQILSVQVLILVLITSCSAKQVAGGRQASNREVAISQLIVNKGKLINKITLTVPETNVVMKFNSKTGTTLNYTAGKSPLAEHGVVMLLVHHIKPFADKGFVTFFAVNRGGSGTDIYLASFVLKQTGYQMKDYFLLGDRVKIVSLDITHNNHICVTYKKHAVQQPMVESPTVIVKKVIAFKA